MRDIIGKSAKLKLKEDGFVLVWALVLMVVLLILGISGIGTSIFESLMTANDALHKQSFFQADGGSNVAGMLIEENVSCSGFTPNNGSNRLILGNVMVENLSLYANDSLHTGVPTNTIRDAYYFFNGNDPGGTSTTLQRTNIRTGGDAGPLAGGPMEQGAGYEGKGFGLPGGGAATNYITFSQYWNMRQSQSVVEIVWQHIIGFEGTCNYR